MRAEGEVIVSLCPPASPGGQWAMSVHRRHHGMYLTSGTLCDLVASLAVQLGLNDYQPEIDRVRAMNAELLAENNNYLARLADPDACDGAGDPAC